MHFCLLCLSIFHKVVEEISQSSGAGEADGQDGSRSE